MAATVTELRDAYHEMFLREQDSAAMSEGSMLSQAFTGLFDHVYKEYADAMIGLNTVDIPKSWRKIDVIREAGALQVLLLTCSL